MITLTAGKFASKSAGLADSLAHRMTPSTDLASWRQI